MPMALPFFYNEHILPSQSQLALDEDNSRHIVQVLRMDVGEQLIITNGRGSLFTCCISNAHRKKCEVSIQAVQEVAPPATAVSIAISPLKNSARFEWFLEKATEIGVSQIIPLLCKRTEKDVLKPARLQSILISALLQSRQAWLPVLWPATKFKDYIHAVPQNSTRLIAHCLEQEKLSLSHPLPSGEVCMLIGPEGDFTPDEIAYALEQKFAAVTLGHTRLRTETAGIAAAALLCIR